MSDLEDLLQFFYLCPVGLVQADREGRVHRINPAASRLLTPAMADLDLTDLPPVLQRLAPGLLEHWKAGTAGSARACTHADQDLWVDLRLQPVSDDRVMLVLLDATREEQLTRERSAWALEVNDSIVQGVIAAETALDLGLPDRAQRLLGAVSATARDWVGIQLGQSDFTRTGSLPRRENRGEQEGSRQ